jgi:hypothetical protein
MTPIDLVRGLARDVSASWSMPRAADLVEIGQDDEGIHVAIPCGETVRRSTMTIDDTLASDLSDGGGRAMDLRTRLSEMVRLQARAASMPGHDASRPPSWSLALPRLFRDLLQASGLTPAMLVERIDAYSGWEPTDLGRDTGISSVSIGAGRMLGTLALTGGSSTVSVMSTDDEDGACTVVIADIQLPETTLLGMEGRDLDVIVSHPGIPSGGRHVVRHVSQRSWSGRQDLHLVLEPDHVWGDEAPADVDLSWRRIREGRRLRLA